MKVCFKTRDGLICLDTVDIDESAPVFYRPLEHSLPIRVRRYERTTEKLAGVPLFEEVA